MPDRSRPWVQYKEAAPSKHAKKVLFMSLAISQYSRNWGWQLPLFLRMEYSSNLVIGQFQKPNQLKECGKRPTGRKRITALVGDRKERGGILLVKGRGRYIFSFNIYCCVVA